MKSPSTPTKGAALIIALAIMILVLALIFGFLSRVQMERGAAHGYASSVSAKILAEDAVQVVQAQIDAATKQGTTVAWTSQPGLIRTFDANGAAQKTYKLYSSPSMWTEGALVPSTESTALADWYKHPSLYTDLNMPADSDFDGNVDKWPILDPSAIGVVEGFAVNSAPTGQSQGITNPVPMPVSWLYILQDGQMVAPTGSGDTATVPGASDTNRIVGRVAFWTDDESCKINVNTAGEGTYWDAPRFGTPQEKALAQFQPAKNEFQAYPGHPATTSLSPVFPGLTRDQIFSLVPRLKNEGSKNATVQVSDLTAAGLDQDRLFATEDELLFSNGRTENTGITRSLLERGKFFLTTSSRAPETNLFNLPRVSCWPIHQTNSSSYRTPFDRLIAFCSTINNQPYYFQRASAASPTDDYDKITRNVTLYGYLKNLMSRKFPGFGDTLSGKYGDDADQILTEIFDYIRSTNLYDGNLAKANRYATGFKANSADNKTRLDYGVVEPIRIGDTKGFGRELSLTEAGIWFICTADPEVPASNNSVDSGGVFTDRNKTLPGVNDPATTWDDRVLEKDTSAGTKQIRIEAAMLLELFTPMQGYAGLRPDIEVKIEGLENFTVQGNADASSVSLGFPPVGDQTETKAGRMIFGKYSHDVSSCYPTGGNMGLWWTLSGRGIRTRNNGRLPQDSFFSSSSDGGTGVTKNRQYPFVSEPVTIRVTTTNPFITFSGGNLTFKILKRATGELVQKVTATLPGGTFPAPLLYNITERDSQTGKITYPAQKKWTFQAEGAALIDDDGDPVSTGRIGGSFGGDDYYVLERNTDVVKSVIPADRNGKGADLRVLAAQNKDINSSSDTHFIPHPLYNDAYRLACSFTEYSKGWSVHVFRDPATYKSKAETFSGKLANMSQNYANASHPDTPLPVPAAQATGDWDNGLTKDSDGPYVNKPDEGNTYINTSTARIPYYESYGAEVFDVSNFFSPNRIMPSPGMFGSLSSGVKRERHWETLLFRRQPGHPNYSASSGGFIANPDYLLLDLFWMPVVEPYAISEPLSTAGKINLNQQIIPFTWVQRNTGLNAVLKQEKVVSVPNADADSYKNSGTNSYRRPINISDTLKQLDYRFSNSDGTGLYAFRTPAEICDFHIIPDDASPNTSTKQSLDQSMTSYWASHALTGDNSRERIYTTVYPRLTTRSNTYTVYYRAQSLKKRPGSNQEVWEENKDLVTGDYRGSTTLERFINPSDSDIKDYAADPNAQPSLDSFYRWRQRSNRPFAP